MYFFLLFRFITLLSSLIMYNVSLLRGSYHHVAAVYLKLFYTNKNNAGKEQAIAFIGLSI